jgi:hypothetical protein
VADFQVQFNGKLFGEPAAGIGAVIAQLQGAMGLSANRLSSELRSWLQGLAQQLAARHSAGWPGGTSAASLSRRSGGLVTALREGISVAGSTVGTLVATWSGNEYLMAHEKGVTIAAHGTRYLAIPLPTALRPNGEPVHANPRDWPNTFVGRSKLGNLLIFMRLGAGVVPLYVLKTSVVLAPRLGLLKSVEAGLPYFVGRALDLVTQSLEGKV